MIQIKKIIKKTLFKKKEKNVHQKCNIYKRTAIVLLGPN